MALVEIDESELSAHKRVTDTMQQLLNNPKARRMVLEAQKVINPNLVIPEIDAAEPLRGELNEVRSGMDDIRKMLVDDRADRERQAVETRLRGQWDAGRAKLKANGYTDEGLEAVEKFMEAKGIADHEVAAAAHERLHPPQEPVRSTGGNRFDLFEPDNRTDESMKALFNNPDDPMALDKIINDTLRQTRGR